MLANRRQLDDGFRFWQPYRHEQAPTWVAADLVGTSVRGCGQPRSETFVTTHAKLERTFTALADPARLAVIALLRKQPLRSGEMARLLSLSRPLMSKHLRILRDAGLVEETSGDDADARARVYRLRQDPFSQVRDWLDEVETFWTDQLGAFKAHAERKYGKRRK